MLQVNGGLEYGLGGMQWELAATLAMAWVIVYLIICKGLHASGKVRKFKIREEISIISFPYLRNKLSRELLLCGFFS